MEIKHIMMHSVETVAADELLCEAARKMASQNIGFLPVWQDGALVGVITDRDIVVRAVARGFDPEQTIVVVLTSGGLKDPGASRTWLPAVPDAPADFDGVLRVLGERYGLRDL